MDSHGLIFIPDISGFSKFVAEIEISHSRAIIQELLEILINENALGLEVSEIEGDAVLFYRFGAAPSAEQMFGQVERMFCAFHRQLALYEIRKYCHCQACITAINLSLKIITHHGEFTTYQVRDFSKLIGKDVIVAHQLLKNEIDDHEYWLVTRAALAGDPPADLNPWLSWKEGVKGTESGPVHFHYASIGKLRDKITPALPLDLEIADKHRVESVSGEYDLPIFRMFHVTGDFTYRSRWMDGVRSIEEVDHFLPRVGMKCRYTMEDGEMVIYSSSYVFNPDRIAFGETDEKKRTTWLYVLEKLGADRTRVTIDYCVRRNLAEHALFRMTRQKQVRESLHRSMKNLGRLVDEIRGPH